MVARTLFLTLCLIVAVSFFCEKSFRLKNIFVLIIFHAAMIPGLEWINDIGGDQWKPLVNGYLPVITLLGLILILPLIFQLIATSYEKRKTISDVEDCKLTFDNVRD